MEGHRRRRLVADNRRKDSVVSTDSPAPNAGLVSGQIYLAPDGRHLVWNEYGWVPSRPPLAAPGSSEWQEYDAALAAAPPIPDGYEPEPEPEPEPETIVRPDGLRYRVESDLFGNPSFVPMMPTRKLGDALATGRPWAITHVYTADSNALFLGWHKHTKSTHATELAVTLATGTDHWGLPQFPCNVDASKGLFVQVENSDERVDRDFAMILNARGLPSRCDHIEFVDRKRSLNLLNDGHLEYLVQAARDGYRWIVFDPLYKQIGSADVSDRSGEVNEILTRLTGLRDLGLTPILTHPLSGHKTRWEWASILGHTYFLGWYETGILVWRSENGIDYKLKVDASRDHATTGKRTIRLRSGGDVGLWEYHEDLQPEPGKPNKGQRSYEKNQRIAKLKAHLAGNPDAGTEELAVLLDVNQRTVERYLKELGRALPRLNRVNATE
jgi:hypothetical protein